MAARLPPFLCNCTLLVLQAVFAHLCLSESSSYDPIAFVRACEPKGIMPLESAITSQNDVGEFQSLLFDRLSELFPVPVVARPPVGLSASDGSTPPCPALSFLPGDDIFTRIFGGKTAQQIIGTGTCRHKRETMQPFLCLALDVTGLATPTIEASLDAFIKVRLLSNR